MSEKSGKSISLLRFLIYWSLCAYAFSVLIGFLSWKFVLARLGEAEWRWDIIYGPLIRLGFYWLFGSIVLIPSYLEYRKQKTGSKKEQTASADAAGGDPRA